MRTSGLNSRGLCQYEPVNISTRELATRRCHAHKTNGDECPNWAIRGGTVCHVHGGRAPQVRMAARERLAAMVDPALIELRRLVDAADSDSVKLAAIKDVLDRAGFKPADRVEATVLNAFTLRIDRGIDDDSV